MLLFPAIESEVQQLPSTTFDETWQAIQLANSFATPFDAAESEPASGFAPAYTPADPNFDFDLSPYLVDQAPLPVDGGAEAETFGLGIGGGAFSEEAYSGQGFSVA